MPNYNWIEKFGWSGNFDCDRNFNWGELKTIPQFFFSTMTLKHATQVNNNILKYPFLKSRNL